MALWRYQSRILGLAGGEGLNTFHCDSSLTSPDPQDFVDAVANFWGTMAPACSTMVDIHGTDIVDVLDPATGQTTGTLGVIPFAADGQSTAEILPSATQGLCKWDTGEYVSGRRLQGKTFIPGPVETNTNAVGGPVAGYVTSIGIAATQLITSGIGLCIYSRKYHTFREVRSGFGWDKWAVLRGRRDS